MPLGSPVFCCYYRADLLEKLHRKPPQTWKEYEELARLLREEGLKSGGRELKYGTVEPLARGWAGLVLLARAAAYAKERDNYTTLFDEKTLEPAIAGPPFVRALEELVAAAKLGPAEQLDFDPAAARAEFWKGNAAMAISWPTRGEVGCRAATTPNGRRAELCLPVSRSCPVQPRSTSPSNAWEPRERRRGPARSAARRRRPHGRGPGGKRTCRRRVRASPLADRSTVGQPGLCRQSRDDALPPLASRRAQGVGREQRIGQTAARQYAEQTAETLSRRQFLASLRLPGRADYLAALDEAVQAAVRGRQKPAEALKAAAEKWREINKRLGVERQKAAYMHSLGLQ